MYKMRGFFLAASAVLFFAGGAAAMDPVLLALNTPAKAAIKIPAEKRAAARQSKPAAEQAKPGYTDFDAVSVNDPLYREGAREMLKEAVKQDGAAKPAVKPVLRDAPISKDPKPVKPAVKPRVKKPVQTDPVKAKNAL